MSKPKNASNKFVHIDQIKTICADVKEDVPYPFIFNVMTKDKEIIQMAMPIWVVKEIAKAFIDNI